MTQRKFRVKLLGQAGSEVAALQPPFDVVAAFERKGRVPVKGTINGFPFRSSPMNMGDGHTMVVNARLRAGAKCKAGDTVAVLMEIEADGRGAGLAEEDHRRRPQGQRVLAEALLYSSERNCARDRGREKAGNPGQTCCRHDGRAPQGPAQEVTSVIQLRGHEYPLNLTNL